MLCIPLTPTHKHEKYVCLYLIKVLAVYMNILWILCGISLGISLAKYTPIQSCRHFSHLYQKVCLIGSAFLGFTLGAFITGFLEHRFYTFVSFRSLEAGIIFTISSWLSYQVFLLFFSLFLKAH